jgi:GntR family transcriptional regulator
MVGIDMTRNDGENITLTTLDFQLIGAPVDVAGLLDLSPGDTVLKIFRLRRTDGIPTRITTHYLPENVGRHVTREILGEKLVLDVLIMFGVIGQSAEDTIGAVLADSVDASLLDVEAGAPLLELTRVVRTKSGVPILLQQSFVPPERQKVRIAVEGDETGLIAIGGTGVRVPARWQ